ncbi:Tubby-related protein 4 [Frankliniella fusca]|uniref:Tubby-related protein 4 n=1 Tax=Frankliniella fusca TaxID=407009 RepID=A0AAE1I127_9NEOP|nr:Tubby-related protein 4 [Frankliniella fusca]
MKRLVTIVMTEWDLDDDGSGGDNDDTGDDSADRMDEGWKLNRHNYYQEGWLATGNVRGIVGVTFTSSHCKKGADAPLRTNYNLRGHHSQPMLIAIKHILHETGNADSFVTDDAILGIPLFPSAGHKSIVAKVDAFRTFTKTR